MEKYIFLSYAHKDASTVMAIAEELSTQQCVKRIQQIDTWRDFS